MPNSKTFIHISDLHLSGLQLPKLHAELELEPGFLNNILNSASNATMRHIADNFSDVDILLMTGDIAGHTLTDDVRHAFACSLDRILSAGTALVVCTGSHDYRDDELIKYLRDRASVTFDSPEWRSAMLQGVEVWGSGSSADSQAKATGSIGRASTGVPTLAVSHRPEDIRASKGAAGELIYAGAGHQHNWQRSVPYVPGSIPAFMVSRYLDSRRTDITQPISSTMCKVSQAGIIHGEISSSGASLCAQRALPVAVSTDGACELTFLRSEHLQPPEWDWLCGPVDSEEEHILLSTGDLGELLPVARVAKEGDLRFTVEFLLPSKSKSVEDAASDIQFYLVDKGEPDPWSYARHHCATASNAYSAIHWEYISGQ